MKGIIYKITNKINGKIYIGQTISTIEKRMYCHKYRAFTKKYNHPLYCAMRKYGFNNFDINIIKKSNNINNSEIKYIKEYNSKVPKGYNIVAGGKNFKHTDDTKDKMSKLAKVRFSIKQNHPMFGKKHSEKTKEILRQKAKIQMEKGNPFEGKKHSEETKEIIRLKRTKQKPNVKIWKVISPIGEIFFIENLKAFCRRNDLKYETLKQSYRNWKCIRVKIKFGKLE